MKEYIPAAFNVPRGEGGVCGLATPPRPSYTRDRVRPRPQPLLHPGQGQTTPPSPSYTRDRVRPRPQPLLHPGHCAPSLAHIPMPTESLANRAPPTASCVQVLSRVTFTM
ncbi:unnamed protein product [Gadus morhua 'NCC']